MDPTLSVAFQVAFGGIMAFTLEKLKDSPAVGWISQHTATINKFLSLVVSVLVSIGIAYTWVADPETGRGTLTLTGVPFTADLWLEIISRTVVQYWSAKLVYLGVIKNKPATP
jgi:hypothetical protein